jgi:hypothetical protein
MNHTTITTVVNRRTHTMAYPALTTDYCHAETKWSEMLQVA